MTNRMSPNWFFLKCVRPQRDATWHDVMSPRLWLHVARLGFLPPFHSLHKHMTRKHTAAAWEQREDLLTQSDDSGLTHVTVFKLLFYQATQM